MKAVLPFLLNHKRGCVITYKNESNGAIKVNISLENWVPCQI